jgi:hypothetical protein
MHEKSTPSNNVTLNCGAIASEKLSRVLVYPFYDGLFFIPSGKSKRNQPKSKNADPRQLYAINPIFSI